jgi:hypothetical protein
LSIPNIYDENWHIVFNVSRGDTTANLTSDIDEYLGNANNRSYNSTGYRNFLQVGGVNCSKTDSNITGSNPSSYCFINTSSNIMYMRVPHFSGVSPLVDGTAPAGGGDEGGDNGGDDSGGGGGGGITSYTISEASLSNGYKMVFAEGTKASFNLASVAHSVTVDDINREENKITVTVSSVPQIATLSIGDKKKFDLNADGFYDLLIELRGIRVIVADLTLTSIYEKMPGSEAESNEAGAEEGVVTSPQVTGEVVQEEGDDDEIEANSKIGLFFGVAVALIVLGAIIAGTYLYFYNRKVKKHLKTAVF